MLHRITGFFCSENAKFAQSLLCSRCTNSRAKVLTRMYIHYSRLMALANAPPFTRLQNLVASIHFSPLTRSFHKFKNFCNVNAKCTQSLLCSRFTKVTGECNHSHVHSLFTANGSSKLRFGMYLHSRVVGDYEHKSKSLQKTDKQT